MSNVHVTARVWLKVNNLKWIGGVVEGVQDKDLVIRTEDGKQVKVPRGSDAVSQRTPQNLEAVDNLTSLPDLDEPNMLHSLCVRYMQNKIYTRTGPILVCMNPWQDLKLYEQAVLRQYRRQKLDSVPPHVFAIAEAAFANLQTERKDQTILVSGDSGSGKTESTKFMMQYLASVAHHTAVTANTEHQVLQCNPVLEAFGNAKTLRNDNSSRFGKYIDIHFDESFALCGAKIDTYLLEKSRVVSQEHGERNFHIFYQLCNVNSGVTKDLIATLRLLSADQFRYTQSGSAVTVGYKPANSFEHTVNALQEIGIQEEERLEIFKVLGSVLHLGNIKVGVDKEENAVLSQTDSDAMLAAELLGVNCGAMVNAMTIRNIQAGSINSGDSYVVIQTQQQTVDSRDALARALYGNMFDVLVARINVSLGQQKRGKTRNISILDIFGFEHFKTNHFEQFCINYANEKLQGHFNEFNFSLEIQEYQRENIQWSYDDFYFQTNTKCIELIEGKRTGMLALLDEQCIIPNGNDETYCTKLKNDIPDHPHLYTAKMKGSKFTLKHYAAEVIYDAEGFCFKNKDPVQPAIVDLMHSSKSTYVQKLFASHWDKMEQQSKNNKGPRQQSSLIFESVTSQFKRQLCDLMLRINAAQPHFVRCINPNSQKSPHKLEPEMILDQLRCSGLMEAVRVSRAGFPVRILHQDFINRFSLLVPMPPGREVMETASKMCQGLRIPQEHYRMGKTKVFMRREINDKLEEERSKLLVKQALTLQRVMRGHIARNYVKYIRVMRQKSAVVMQKVVRRLLVRRWYLDMLHKRRLLLEQQERERRNAAGGTPAGTAATAAAVPLPTPGLTSFAAPPGGYPAAAPTVAAAASTVNFTPGGATYARGAVPHVSQQMLEELELNLQSVRELYYNERSSQLALSNLVREIHTLQDPDAIMKRIKQLEDKIATQRKEANNGVIVGDKFEEEGLGRRTDSLTACKALLEEKMNLILQSQRVPNRSDFARMRADMEREFQAEMSAKLRVASEAQIQLDAARAELRRRDEEIAMLNNKFHHMRDQNYGDSVGTIDVHSLDAVKQQMMDDRAKLEAIIRKERKEREEEFNDMDANVRARDERIKELEAQLLDFHRRMQMKDKQVDELSILVQQRVNGGGGGFASGGDAALHRSLLELQQQRAQLQRDNAVLEQKLAAASSSGRIQGGGGQGMDAGDAERMEALARQLATAVHQTQDPGSLGGSAVNILQSHIKDCTEQQRVVAGSGDGGRLQALSAQRRMLELSGVGGGDSTAETYAPSMTNYGVSSTMGGGSSVIYQQVQRPKTVTRGEDMVLM